MRGSATPTSTSVSWCLTGAVFPAWFEIVGLDGYEGREASIVDSVNFRWVLVHHSTEPGPARRPRAHVGTNNRWCREPKQKRCFGRLPLVSPDRGGEGR